MSRHPGLFHLLVCLRHLAARMYTTPFEQAMRPVLGRPVMLQRIIRTPLLDGGFSETLQAVG
jgi:hypothetical protein